MMMKAMATTIVIRHHDHVSREPFQHRAYIPQAPCINIVGIMFNQRIVWHKGNFKLLSYDGGKRYKLYNLKDDPSEKTDISAQNPEMVEQLKKDVLAWHESVKASFEGSEYGTKSLERLGKNWSSPLTAKAKSGQSKGKKKKTKKEKKL